MISNAAELILTPNIIVKCTDFWIRITAGVHICIAANLYDFTAALILENRFIGEICNYTAERL